MEIVTNIMIKSQGEWICLHNPSSTVRTGQLTHDSEWFFHTIRRIYGTLYGVRDPLKAALTVGAFKRALRQSPSGFLSITPAKDPNTVIVVVVSSVKQVKQ